VAEQITRAADIALWTNIGFSSHDVSSSRGSCQPPSLSVNAGSSLERHLPGDAWRPSESDHDAALLISRLQENSAMISKQTACISARRTARWPILFAGAILTASLSFSGSAKAQNSDAGKLLKAMADYVSGQKSLAIEFDSDIEVITPSLQKIQFTTSGQVQLSRPNKLRITRTGGYTDVEIVFDGKTLSINNKDANGFAQVEAPGSVDQFIDMLRDKYGMTAPGADLLFANAYTLRIKEWRTEIASDAFAFKPAQSAKKLALSDLTDIDELPQGAVTTGGKK
jgi:hypothetical protein